MLASAQSLAVVWWTRGARMRAPSSVTPELQGFSEVGCPLSGRPPQRGRLPLLERQICGYRLSLAQVANRRNLRPSCSKERQ